MGTSTRKPARAEPPRAERGARPARAEENAAGADALTAKSKKELYEQAKRLGVPGRSAMSRDELLAALRKAG
jgi:hypothetical protein